jgi:hypothetical protein
MPLTPAGMSPRGSGESEKEVARARVVVDNELKDA